VVTDRINEVGESGVESVNVKFKEDASSKNIGKSAKESPKRGNDPKKAPKREDSNQLRLTGRNIIENNSKDSTGMFGKV
jgi:hypothetical protein